CAMNSRNSCFNFVIMWQSSKISAMYFMDKDSKLSNLFQQASSPTTGTAPRSQSRLSVCPSTQDICRSTTLHDLSEDELEHATPVMVLAPSNREPGGKKLIKRRFRRKREAGDN
ncbi:hypothetical protein DV515_00002689, partial [Chloebia gouldiae]